MINPLFPISGKQLWPFPWFIFSKEKGATCIWRWKTQSQYKLFIWEKEKKRNKPSPCDWAGLEIRHGGTQENHLAQLHNARKYLPKEGSGLGNIAPLLVFSEQMMNASTRLRGWGWGRWEVCAHSLSSQSHWDFKQRGRLTYLFLLFRTLRVERRVQWCFSFIKVGGKHQ